MRKRLLTKLRVHHGLLVDNMVEGHHEGVLYAACGRKRAPGVITTTLYALTLAPYMQVITTVEENARNAPAWSSRSNSSPPTIANVMEKRQSALQKNRMDRATARPTGEGWS